MRIMPDDDFIAPVCTYKDFTKMTTSTASTVTSTTTCQICGRQVKSKNGHIAHHGYKRPDQGWQTASCRGARHLPYEVSCDALQPTINEAQAYITRTNEALAELQAAPPAELSGWSYRGSGRYEPVKYVRPEGFDQANISRFAPSDYEVQFQKDVRQLQADVLGTERHVAYLEARLAAWVAPVAVTA